MATIQFKEASPYSKPNPTPPTEDYLYKKFLDDFTMKGINNYPLVKIALFGVGRAGTIHLTNLVNNPRTKLLYIIDDVEKNWENLKKYWHLDDVLFLNSKQSDRVFEDANVDAVVVASPTFTHENIVVKALKAKKAIFCEKPIAEQRQNIVNCFEVAKKARKPLFCAFNRRFDPSYNIVRERIMNGDVGHVHMIKCTARDSPLPSIEYLKTSGGIFHDCMVHDIDLMIWMIGEYPTKVACQASAIIPEIKSINDFDTVAATLYFPSGTLGIIDLSRNSPYGYDQRIEVFGPKGSVNADNEQPVHCITYKDSLKGVMTAPIWYSFASRFKLAYLREMDHFLDIVVGNVELKVKPHEILAVNKIATAVEESARTGNMVEIKWANGELQS